MDLLARGTARESISVQGRNSYGSSSDVTQQQQCPFDEGQNIPQAEGVKPMMQVSSDSALLVGTFVVVALLIVMLALAVFRRIVASR